MLLSLPSACWCPPFVCVVAVLNGGGVCCGVPRVRIGYGILCCLAPLVLPHPIVGLGACLCDRVVSLWNGGDGLCAGRNGGDVYCLLLIRCVLWVVEWRCVCGLVLSSLLFLSLLCVGVRGSARAALRARTLSPNTIVFPCCLVFSFVSFVSRFSSACLEWRGSPCVGVFGGHDGYG